MYTVVAKGLGYHEGYHELYGSGYDGFTNGCM